MADCRQNAGNIQDCGVLVHEIDYREDHAGAKAWASLAFQALIPSAPEITPQETLGYRSSCPACCSDVCTGHASQNSAFLSAL